ncbi:MAG: signal peptide peptidase SppA [Kordiimonadales bacterium]|nr:MAG: signal peptide peptidase SppA [Kordiimonadales bacterium]
MKGIWVIFKSIGKFIQGLGTLTLGVLVLLFITFFFAATATKPLPSVPEGAVLVLAPTGAVVEQIALKEPFDSLLPESQRQQTQTSIYDVTTALKRAKNDDRISALALNTDYFAGAGPSHLHTMVAAIRDFKSSGKKVYAISTSYGQSGYILAAEADKIYMNPYGQILMTGLGSYPLYFKGFLENISATVNVFKVGTYKAAVEPFLRDDMSPAAKEANLAFLGSIWDQHTASVEQSRGMEAGSIQSTIESLGDKLRAAGGDFGQMAIDTGLVDVLAARNVWRKELSDEYGSNEDGDSFNQIHYKTYLKATGNQKKHRKKIAVITAQGPIVMGSGPITQTAAETVVGYIRDARENSNTAAIVLRIDSGGGSAFASELIRQELVAAQAQGIKVIASMGPVAASGGYWIAATADEIWAAPTTITGSIGIFAMIPTFEKSLDRIGVHSDGVGTTPFADAFNPTRAMNGGMKDLVQQSIEAGYGQFLSLVAKGRNMTVEDVDKIAQGRVWAGIKAKELGLVDHLGGFDDAVAAAATAAGIEDYSVVFYRDKPSKWDQVIEDALNSSIGTKYVSAYAASGQNQIIQQALDFKKHAEFLLNLNDPMGRYVVCLTCEVN